MITSLTEFSMLLLQAQACRAETIRCEFSPALSARLSDAALAEALVCGLPMVQGVQHRILRNRGRGIILTARLRYRDGVRILSASTLTDAESTALEAARGIVSDFLTQDENGRFKQIYSWICLNIRYAHTAPGQKGYERLVGACGVLTGRRANCQGFADLLYLLCGLCSIQCEYRIGRGEKHLHVWNAVHINGAWQEVDVSKSARQPEIDISQTNFPQAQKTTTQDAKNMLY